MLRWCRCYCGVVNRVDELLAEVRAQKERMSRLSEACLAINESLELEKVLQGVLDSARTLIGARYGWMLLRDAGGWIVDYVASGLTAEQGRRFWETPGMIVYQKQVEARGSPWRMSDLSAAAEELGVPRFTPPFPVSEVIPAMVVEISHRGERIGFMYVFDRHEDAGAGAQGAFTDGDEEVLVMFAAQAALVIANARRHRDEQRARADMEALVNSVPVGVMVFDAETRGLVSANWEARRIVGGELPAGGSVEEALSSTILRRADGQEVPAGELPIVRVLESGQAALAEEFTVETAGGAAVDVLVNATPVHADDGPVESVVVTLQDIGPLADMERLRTEFLGMVGHELRMPLTSIKGSAAALLAGRSTLSSAETEEFHRIIDEQADYMQSLIADLVDVVRIETGTLSVTPDVVEVSRVVDGARNNFLSAGGRDNIRIDLAPDLPPVIAEARRIVQVISNLLSNASRNSHDESAIQVNATFDGIHVAISVADTGQGLPAEQIPHLFTKFHQPRGTLRDRDLGLGLAICKGIVEAHGGRIWAESDGPGLGSRFTFTIPAAEPGATSGRDDADAGTPEEDTSGRTRVLAVDDDPRTLKVVRDTLEAAGYEAIVTGDPQQLSSLIHECDPSVLLLDMMLPNTDGIELMRSVLAGYDTPVIFLSAYERTELITKAFELGAVDYIVKPFAPTELAARVRAALRKAPEQSTTFTLGDLVIDYADRSVTVAGHHVELTPLEYGLLTELSANAGAALTYEQILDRVWGADDTGDAGLVRTIVKNLRRKLDDNIKTPKYIVTVSRIGYRMPKPSPRAS